MRLLARTTIVVLLGALPLGLIAGCSGTGAPTEPDDLIELRALADAHLTSVLMLKSWFAYLYPPPEESAEANHGPCTPGRERLPSLPDDPPGSSRVRYTYADCTVVEALWRDDNSGEQTIREPDDHVSRLVWGPVRPVGAWMLQHRRLELWDGAVFEYDGGGLPGSADNRKRKIGSATLPDGRPLDFQHLRSDILDRLELAPYDGSALSVRVPLRYNWRSGYHPLFAEGATGSFTDVLGRAHTFALAGASDQGWQTWRLRSEAGMVGEFTIRGDFGGAGEFRAGRRTVAVLTWGPDGAGTLRPLGASALTAVASSAARDFQIDQWIGHVAMLSPVPRY